MICFKRDIKLFQSDEKLLILTVLPNVEIIHNIRFSVDRSERGVNA